MITNFRGLLDDKVRIEALQKAINELISPNHSVLEIGSALGTYSLFAARQNAHKVYAVEMDDIYYAGLEIAKRNGLLDKINFIKGKSTDIGIDKQVDFIIMEDYSPFFIYENLEKTIIDARNRFLKPDGKFIPNEIIMKVAPVEATSLHNQIDLWQKEKDRLYDINWDYTTELAFNRPYYAETHPLKMLTPVSTIKTIDLSKDSDFPFAYQTEVEIIEAGMLHGLAGWWDTWFTPAQFFSNSPAEPTNTWGQMFFPFQYPIKVQKGDRIIFQIQVLESKKSGNIDFKWEVEHSSSIQEYNSLRGSFLPSMSETSRINKNQSKLNAEGEIAHYILNLLHQGLDVDKIGIMLDKKFANSRVSREKCQEIFDRILNQFA